MKELAILVLSLVLNFTYTSAQWIRTNGLNEAKETCTFEVTLKTS